MLSSLEYRMNDKSTKPFLRPDPHKCGSPFPYIRYGTSLNSYHNVGETRESWAMFYILYHSAEMKGRIPKLNVVSKTLESLVALYNVTVGPIAAVYPQEGYRKKMVKWCNSPYAEESWATTGGPVKLDSMWQHRLTRPLHVQHTYYRIIFKQNPFNIISRGVQGCTSTDFG